MTIKHNMWSGIRCWTSKETHYTGYCWNNVDFILDNTVVSMSKFLNVMIILRLYKRSFLFLKDTGVRG